MKKLNEVAIFESFRIQPSKDEKIEVERIKKQFKESPISTTGWMILEGIAAPFVSRADQTVDYYKKTIPPTMEELRLHKEYIKSSLKKNYFN